MSLQKVTYDIILRVSRPLTRASATRNGHIARGDFFEIVLE